MLLQYNPNNMKLRLISAITLMGLLFSACLKEESPGVQDNAGMTLRAGLPSVQTRTWLDYPSGGRPLKVYWSDGDKLNVNGQVSLPLSVADGEKKTEADFQLLGLEPPYSVVYPAEAVTEAGFAADGTVTVELPSTQAYSPTSFANGSAMMYGYSESSESVTLHNLCAAVRINIKAPADLSVPDDAVIVEAKLISESKDAPLCGTFNLSPELGTLTAVEGKTELVLDLGQVTLDGVNGTDFFITIPAGDYSDGLVFYFTRKSDHMKMQNFWSPEDPLEAGKLYSFNNVTYEPVAKEIETVDDWTEFATAVNESQDLSKYLFKGNVVRLGADLSAEELTPVTTEFKYTFDGNGRTITRTAAAEPLFSSLSGEIRNLTLAGSLVLAKASGAPLLDVLMPGGKVTSCTNRMSVKSVTAEDTHVSGLVRLMQGGTIENCTNSGKVDVTVDVDGGIYSVAVAGIVAEMMVPDDAEVRTIVLKGCTNTSELVLTPQLTFQSVASTSDKGMKVCAFAGIAGWIRNAAAYTFDNCDNKGQITLSAKGIQHERGNSPRPIAVGGVLGLAAPVEDTGLLVDPKNYPDDSQMITLTGCDNSALIHNCGINYSSTRESNNKAFTGGLVGCLAGRSGSNAKLISCTSTGNIIPYDIIDGAEGYVVSSRPAYSVVAGGLVGFGGYLDMDGCTVACQIGNGKRPMVAWGGVIGYALRPFILNDCSLDIFGYYQRLTGYKMNRAVVAVVPVKYSSNAMNIVPDVSGSQITGSLDVSGYIFSSGTTLTSSTDSKNDISQSLSTKLFTTKAKVIENLVCGEGFTANAGVSYENATIVYTE